MDDTKDKIKKSLKYSILDGALYSAMVGLGESFLSVFAVFLKATSFQLGLIGSLPYALGSISEIYSNKLLKIFKTRKRMVAFFALLQGLMYIPIALVFFFGEMRVFHLILFTCIYFMFGMILSPAWNSWMGDLVKDNERGKYFGKRNEIAGLVAFFTFLIGGYVLQQYTNGDKTQYIGFTILFGLALMFRIGSFAYLLKKYEPPFAISKSAEFSLLEFIKQAGHRNFGLFVLYLCMMNFSVYIAAPFFTAYMLNDLKFGYMTFTIVTGTAIIVKYLTMPLWGKAIDRYGTKKLFTLAAFTMPLVPFLWAISTNVWWLILVQIYSGLSWAGFELATMDFIFDATTPEKRATCVAYYNVLNGVAIFIGAMLGSIIVKYNHIFFSSYIIVFIMSFAARYIASATFIPMLKEVRTVESITYTRLFIKAAMILPTAGIMHRMITLLPYNEKIHEKKDKK